MRHGMASFVKGMIPAVQRFVEERRQRCLPFAEDPASFGCRQLAPASPPPAPAQEEAACGLTRCASVLSTASCGGSESGCSLEDSASERGGMPRTSSMRRLGAMMLASGEPALPAARACCLLPAASTCWLCC